MFKDFEKLRSSHNNRMKYKRYLVRCIFVFMLIFSSAFISYFLANGKFDLTPAKVRVTRKRVQS